MECGDWQSWLLDETCLRASVPPQWKTPRVKPLEERHTRVQILLSSVQFSSTPCVDAIRRVSCPLAPVTLSTSPSWIFLFCDTYSRYTCYILNILLFTSSLQGEIWILPVIFVRCTTCGKRFISIFQSFLGVYESCMWVANSWSWSFVFLVFFCPFQFESWVLMVHIAPRR